MDTRAPAKEAQSRSRCHSPGSDSLRSSLTETPRSTKKHKGHPLGWGGITLSGKLNLTASPRIALTMDSSAHLCHGTSRLSTCSSGCVGRNPGTRVKGWCQCFPGCNRRTRLGAQVQWQTLGAREKERRGHSDFNDGRCKILRFGKTYFQATSFKGG